MKRFCYKCGCQLTDESWSVANRVQSRNVCNPCYNAVSREYSAKNREHLKAYHAAWREKNAERVREYNRAAKAKSRAKKRAELTPVTTKEQRDPTDD